ncbi:fibrous sheath-interacting 1 isoform X1 [Labeo rohita]|uniref:Fibrous sheath-interacting protein 1 n=1 Tax=Labeo rohita TaxID=84645 RepID=A0A498LBB9_LABRO|nr:fibrous sheath-interacting 1 isoform X1 [Labeo rohita]
MEVSAGDMSRSGACDESPRTLELISPDHTALTDPEAFHEKNSGCLTLAEKMLTDQEESDEETEDPELRKAIKKMKRLDRTLALKASAEREVKQRGKEQHQRLCQELQAVNLRMSSNEMENTRRFLALTPNNYQDCDEVDFVPVFETEVLDLKNNMNTRHETEEHAGQQVMEDQPADGRQRGAARSKRRQDFVKRNIELAGATGNSFLLTQQEKERIEELLKDLEEELDDSDLLTEPQVVSSSLSVGEAFSPEPSERHSLHHIDSRLQLLLPVQDFLSVRSPSQESLQENTGDTERRLREIQLQLQLLEEDEPSASVRLSSDQLRNLLLECEEEMIRSPAGSSSESSLRTSSALDASPRLSGSDLLRDAAAQ